MKTLTQNCNGNIELTIDEFEALIRNVWLEGYTDCQLDNFLNTSENQALRSWLESLSKNQLLCIDNGNINPSKILIS